MQRVWRIATETVEHFVLDCPNSELCKIIRATCKSLGVEPKIEIIISHKRIVDTIHRNNQTEIIEQRQSMFLSYVKCTLKKC